MGRGLRRRAYTTANKVSSDRENNRNIFKARHDLCHLVKCTPEGTLALGKYTHHPYGVNAPPAVVLLLLRLSVAGGREAVPPLP